MVQIHPQETCRTQRFSWTAKIAVAAALCLGVRAIVAQAPNESLIREEIDAQGFKYQVPNETLRKNKGAEGKARSEVRAVLKGEASIADAATRLKFRAYFQSYLYPMMTTEDGLKTVAQDRVSLFRDIASAASQEAHRDLVDLTLQTMTKIVQDNGYRPAARYNAMYIISSLNDVEAKSVGAGPPTLPDPMKTALPIIFQQFQKGDTDEIKIAALLGLARHLEWDNYKQPPATSAPIPAAQRTAIVKELTSLAEAKEVPPARDAEVHIWMRRRAIEALSMACLVKPDPEIAATMDGILKDESSPVPVRMSVAAALGRVALPQGKIEPVPTAKELGYLALAACEVELTKAEAQRKADFEHQARLMGTYTGDEGGYGAPGLGGMPGMATPGGMRPGGGMGGEGGIRGRPTPGSGLSGEGGYGSAFGDTTMNPAEMDPKHYQMEYLRRRLRQQLYAVQLGLTGGEDHPPPKTRAPGAPSAPPPTAPPATSAPPAGSGPAAAPEKKGLHALAKPGQEKGQVDEVYYCVRKLAEVVEDANDKDPVKAEFHQFLKDMRKELKPLEAVVGKRLPPPGAAAPGAISEDAPAVSGVGGKAPAKGGPATKGPAVPARGPAVPGKSASVPRPQPQVFGQPRPR